MVGAPHEDPGSSNAGSAYVFEVHSGAQIHKLSASDGQWDEFFGSFISVEENRALVGKERNNGSYLFDLATGQELQILRVSGQAVNYEQRPLALRDGFALIGYPGSRDAGANSGIVFAFNAETGQEIWKLRSNDIRPGDRFGKSIATSGGTAVIGAPFADATASESGKAYVFDLLSGRQISQIAPSDKTSGDNFGWSVALDGVNAIVGAPGDDDRGTSSGSVYHYDISGKPGLSDDPIA